MTRSSKLVLFVAVSFIGLPLLLVAVAALVLRGNATPRLQAMASEALEMEVTVGGRVAVGFLPGLHVALADVHARKQGAEVASAEEVDVGIELLPLIHGDLRIATIGVKRLRIAIERDGDGKLNLSRSPRTRGTRAALAVAEVSVSDASLHYVNQQSGKELEAAECALAVKRHQLSSGESPDALENLSLTAQLACGRVQAGPLVASDVRLSADGKDGVFDLAPVTMHLFGGQGSGNLRADFSGSMPVYQLRYELSKFQIEEFFKFMSPNASELKSVGKGLLDFSAHLSLQGKTTEALKRSAAGEASLGGVNLTLEIGNLDEQFSRYESSQNFNLVDVGAVFFAGPLGLGLTKGYDFARILEGSGGSTEIRTLVSNWQVERGVAHAVDVAMATENNRVALKGGLDFVSERFDEVTVALIDDKGCARVKQRIHGPFRQPEVEKPDVLSVLTGPTRKLLERAKDLFGNECDVFYAGSVVPPG